MSRNEWVINGLTKAELGQVMRLYYKWRGRHLPAFLARRMAAIEWGIRNSK